MKKLVTGLWLAVLAISIVGAHLWRELGAEREQNTALDARVAGLESVRLAQVSAPRPPEPVVPPSPIASAQSAAAQPVSTAASTAAAAAPAARAQSAGGNANPMMAAVGQSMNSPEGRELTRTMMRMTLAQQYADLAKELNLSPEEEGKLLDLLARQRADQGTDRMNLQLGGTRDRAEREQMARALAEKEQAHEAELAAMLGSKYPQWKEYQRTDIDRQRAALTRQQEERLRGAVSSSSSPLSEAQFQALNTALAAEQRRIDQDSRGLSMQQQVQRLAEDNRRLADVAAAHLAPEQLERYRRYQQQQAEMTRAMMGALGAAGNTQGQAPAASPGAPD